MLSWPLKQSVPPSVTQVAFAVVPATATASTTEAFEAGLGAVLGLEHSGVLSSTEQTIRRALSLGFCTDKVERPLARCRDARCRSRRRSRPRRRRRRRRWRNRRTRRARWAGRRHRRRPAADGRLRRADGVVCLELGVLSNASVSESPGMGPQGGSCELTPGCEMPVAILGLPPFFHVQHGSPSSQPLYCPSLSASLQQNLTSQTGPLWW